METRGLSMYVQLLGLETLRWFKLENKFGTTAAEPGMEGNLWRSIGLKLVRGSRAR